MSNTNNNMSKVAQAHENHVSETGQAEIKYPFAFKQLDWDQYHFYRPQYPQSMWDMWFQYAKEHGGKFHLAHDLGAGPGTAAKVLVQHFDHVLVSDPGESNLATAQSQLTPRDKFTFTQAAAESCAGWVDEDSVDLACACMAFHYFAADGSALPAIAKTLVPGKGMLAAVTYGFRLRFPGNERLEDLWYATATKEGRNIIRNGGLFPAAVAGMGRAMAGLDFVGLDADVWEDVRRVYVNCDGWTGEEKPFAFVGDEVGVVETADSRVGEADVIERMESEDWGRRTDVGWLKGFLVSCQIGFGEATWMLEEWKELEAIIEAAGGEVEMRWPVAMILATKRKL